MTNERLYIAIGIPAAINAALLRMVVMCMNSKFEGVNQRFDDIRDLWRAELRRVAEVIDARLKHLEERA
jgi:hypothetical protein